MNKVGIIKLFSVADSIAASGVSTSIAIELDRINLMGLFSFYMVLAGDGTAKVEYELSHDGTVWMTPVSAGDIVTAHIKTSGVDSAGKDIYKFEPELSANLRIKITETSTTDAIYVNGFLAIL